MILKKLNYISLVDFNLVGFYNNFLVKSNLLKTQLGNIELKKGLNVVNGKVDGVVKLGSAREAVTVNAKLDLVLVVAHTCVGDLTAHEVRGAQGRNQAQKERQKRE